MAYFMTFEFPMNEYLTMPHNPYDNDGLFELKVSTPDHDSLRPPHFIQYPNHLLEYNEKDKVLKMDCGAGSFSKFEKVSLQEIEINEEGKQPIIKMKLKGEDSDSRYIKPYAQNRCQGFQVK